MKKRQILFWMILFPYALLVAQPNHSYLLYSDKLDQPTSTAFSEFVNNGGAFITAKGWQATTTKSQLFIALPKDLPAEGTFIIDVNKFNPVAQNADVKQNIINLYSQRNGSKDIFETDGSWWNIRTGTGYSEGSGMAGFKFLAAPRGIDSREEERCIERKSDWRESLWYQFKVVWTREKTYCFFDGDLVSTLPFEGQIEMFKFIFLGTDNVYAGQPGPIYGNLRIYGAEPDPATIFILTKISGDGQSGAPSQQLALPLVVRVTNQLGVGISNTPVMFVPQNGGGMVESQPVLTNADGYALSSFLLGSSDGRYSVIATSEKTGTSQIVFYADAVTPDTYSLLAVSGNGQTGEPGKQLALPFIVRVQNQKGIGTPDILVTFAPHNGGNMAEIQPVLTDADGQARAFFVLGENEGAYSVSVTSDKTGGASVQFSASAVKPKIAISKSSGDEQTGTVGQALAAPCVVLAKDDLGRIVADVEIEFFVETGAGSIVDGSSVKKIRTDTAGYASASWTLGTRAGVQHLYAKFEETTLTFSASAGVGAPKRLINTTDGGPYTAGKSYEFACRLEDDYGNPCIGAQIAFTVESGNGNINGSKSAELLTDDQGVAKVTWMLGLNHTYINRLSAKLNGSTDGSLSVIYQLENILPPSLEQSMIVADSIAVADGADSVRIRVTLKNDDGLALPDYAVNILVSGQLNQLVIADSVTNTAGEMTAVLRSTAAEIKSITAFVIGVGVLPKTVEVAFREPHSPYIHLMSVLGNEQSGIVGRTLPQALVVWVVDEQNRPRADVSVEFQVKAGGGLINGQSLFETVSNGSGLAQATWTLGNRAGFNSDSIRVTLPGIIALPIYFVASAQAGPPDRLISLIPDSLTAVVGDFLRLKVRVQDAFGNPTPQIPVLFEALQNGAMAEPQPVPTNSSGESQATAVIGNRPGVSTFQATLQDMPALHWTVFVRETRERLIAMPADTVKLSESRDVELAVICVDGSGASLQNIPVQFSRIAGAGDFLGSPGVVSDAGGHASVIWRPVESTETTVIQATSPNDSVRFYIRFIIQSSDPKHDLPTSLSLGDNYPNPFNPSTTIPFTLTEAGHVALQVYDVSGRLVSTLLEGQMTAGAHAVVFNAVKESGENLPSGIYFYKLVADEFEETKQLLLIK